MRIRLVVDGEERTLEVDLARGEARLGERPVPFRVVARKDRRLELLLDGEPYTVEGLLPEGPEEDPSELAINRERYRVGLKERGKGGPPVSDPGPASPSPKPLGAPSRAEGGPGVAIVPPMPGKVLEVRVTEGTAVAAGQTLLVLEAMKMRNEVLSPQAGRVQGLAVSPGQMVKAREVLLRVVPA